MVEGIEDGKIKLNTLEVVTKANLLDVRWKVANEMTYMGQKVHRHPIEQRWRDESALNPLFVFPHPVLQYCQHHSLSSFRWNVPTR